MQIRALAFLLAVGAPVFCQAQEPRAIEISPYSGYIFGGKTLDTQYLVGQVADHSTYGIRLDYGISPSVLAEIQASRSDSDLLDNGQHSGIPIRTDLLLGYGKFLLSYRSLQPYVQFGAGVAQIDTIFIDTVPRHETRTRFTGSLAAGIDWFPFSHLGARIDARGYATDIRNDAIALPCTTFEYNSGGALVPVQCKGKRWLLNTEASTGVVFRF